MFAAAISPAAVIRWDAPAVIGAFGVVFALAVAYRLGARLGLDQTIVILALTVMLATKLIGFLMLSIRQEAVSQIIGLLLLDNGIRIGAVNANVPKGADPAALTMEEAVALLAAREGKSGGKTRRAKPAPKTANVVKTRKPAAKKAAKKKKAAS